jgi:hypothetical protein
MAIPSTFEVHHARQVRALPREVRISPGVGLLVAATVSAGLWIAIAIGLHALLG